MKQPKNFLIYFMVQFTAEFLSKWAQNFDLARLTLLRNTG